MRPHSDKRTEAALYWTAVSLIVCEGLSIDKAAERLGVDEERLRMVLQRRQSLRSQLNRRTSASVVPLRRTD